MPVLEDLADKRIAGEEPGLPVRPAREALACSTEKRDGGTDSEGAGLAAAACHAQKNRKKE